MVLRTSKRFATVSWVLVVAMACFIFYASSNTGDDLSHGSGLLSGLYQVLQGIQTQVLGPDSDFISSLGHFCEYTVFGALLANALRCHLPLRRACAVAIVCASLYGVTDEFHQLFVPDRMTDPVDWLVDTVGGSLGAGLAWLALRKRVCSDVVPEA